MSAVAVLVQIERAGVVLYLAGDRLRGLVTPGAFSAELRALVDVKRASSVEALERNNQTSGADGLAASGSGVPSGAEPAVGGTAEPASADTLADHDSPVTGGAATAGPAPGVRPAVIAKQHAKVERLQLDDMPDGLVSASSMAIADTAAYLAGQRAEPVAAPTLVPPAGATPPEAVATMSDALAALPGGLRTARACGSATGADRSTANGPTSSGR